MDDRLVDKNFFTTSFSCMGGGGKTVKEFLVKKTPYSILITRFSY